MESPRKRSGQEMQDDQQPKASKVDTLEYSEITQTLQILEDGITDIRTSLDKPKGKRVTLKEIDRKVDLILEILNSWNTA